MSGAFYEQPSTRTRLQAFRFCGVADIGACLAVSRRWHKNADCEITWASLYEHTQRVDIAHEVNGPLRALIERPFGEAAVGWRVAVLADFEEERYDYGRIAKYNANNDSYLVAYDGHEESPPRETWELERMRQSAAISRNPSLAGRSRFSFIAPPGNCWSHRPNPLSRKTAPLDWSLNRCGSWKRELENNVRSVPSRQLQRLADHRDEVLFVIFSPCGTRLASCSRDCSTRIFGLRWAAPAATGEGRPSATPGPNASVPFFEVEAELLHGTPACRAAWWPAAEPGASHSTIIVLTEDISYHAFHGESFIEVWEVPPPDPPSAAARSSPGGRPSPSRRKRKRKNACCIFRKRNQPFDIHTAIIAWPPSGLTAGATVLSSRVDAGDRPDPRADLCFLAGQTISLEAGMYVQWLEVWPGPQRPEFRRFAATGVVSPLAWLRAPCGVNYLHALQAEPGERCSRLLALTGSTPHMCDELARLDLGKLKLREDGDEAAPVYDMAFETRSMGERIILSVRWSKKGDFILLNTRPYASAKQRCAVNAGSEEGETAGGYSSCSSRATAHEGPPRATLEEALQRPVPDLSTSIELLLLDSRTLNCVGVFDGHFAFTTKECPFSIFTDEWSDGDFLASGGEDQDVYIWHRRHRRLVRRLCGHTAPVNAVSWNGRGLLASASDDNSVIIWSALGDTVAQPYPY